MKKIILSTIAVLAMSSLATAGGDIAPVEPVIDEAIVVASDSTFYIGAAYGYMSEDYTRNPDILPLKSFDEDFSSVMLQAGYKFNPYIAIEGRYWFGVDDVTLAGYADNVDAPDSFGLYAKPMYPVTDAFDIYALLGYAWTDTSLNKIDGFSWGVGASYSFADNVALFVDYTSLYNTDEDHTVAGTTVNKDYDIDTWNFGVTYQF